MTLPADDTILFLHNPRCSKSRRTEELLGERGVAFRVRRYLDEPLDRAELEDLCARLGRPVREWARTREEAWAEAGLDESATDDQILDAMAAAPILMERPIVVRGRRAAVGRPPESVLAIVDPAPE